MEKTLAIIKPDVIQKRKVGEVISMIEKNFEIVEMKMVRISRKEAIEFYTEHKGKDFFDRLIDFMTSGPIIPMVIQGEDVIKKFREFVGDTDPKKAKEGTIRRIFGEDLPRNAIHASDSQSSAYREISFFFGPT
ncbi:MAG: nucleoside-diphosphate kinase [Brevinematia bacterium]